MAVDECSDGRHDTGDGRADESRHAGDGAKLDRLLGRHVARQLVGGMIAYPVNVWLVAMGLKHGMGSVRALGEGGHSLEAEATRMGKVSGERCSLSRHGA